MLEDSLRFFPFAQGGIYVLVAVEPEGIVAIPHVDERQFIIFNIGRQNVWDTV